MGTAGTNTCLEEMLHEFGVFWHAWPVYVWVHGERRQIGVELELTGSHSQDPEHLDPDCAECQRVRSVLVAAAEHITERLSSAQQTQTSWEIEPHYSDIVSSPSLGYRPCVTVSICITQNDVGESPADLSDTPVVENLRRCLLELRIPEH